MLLLSNKQRTKALQSETTQRYCCDRALILRIRPLKGLLGSH